MVTIRDPLKRVQKFDEERLSIYWNSDDKI